MLSPLLRGRSQKARFDPNIFVDFLWKEIDLFDTWGVGIPGQFDPIIDFIIWNFDLFDLVYQLNL